MSLIDAQKVRDLFTDSLFRDDEDHSEFLPAKGLVTNVGFHPQRLESHEKEVHSLLLNLPESFQENSGGGYSFLAMPMDKNEEQWGEQRNAEELLLLGIALGWADIVIPRELWSAFPGGVPYIVVHSERRKRDICKA